MKNSSEEAYLQCCTFEFFLVGNPALSLSGGTAPSIIPFCQKNEPWMEYFVKYYYCNELIALF